VASYAAARYRPRRGGRGGRGGKGRRPVRAAAGGRAACRCELPLGCCWPASVGRWRRHEARRNAVRSTAFRRNGSAMCAGILSVLGKPGQDGHAREAALGALTPALPRVRARGGCWRGVVGGESRRSRNLGRLPAFHSMCRADPVTGGGWWPAGRRLFRLEEVIVPARRPLPDAHRESKAMRATNGPGIPGKGRWRPCMAFQGSRRGGGCGLYPL